MEAVAVTAENAGVRSAGAAAGGGAEADGATGAACTVVTGARPGLLARPGALESRATTITEAMTTGTATMASAPSAVGVQRAWRLKSGSSVAGTSTDADQARSDSSSLPVVIRSGLVVAAAGVSAPGGVSV